MKWLKSTTNKSWTALGRTIQGANGNWLQVTDSDWAQLSVNPVIKSLMKAGGILVLDHAPAEEATSVSLAQQEVAQLRLQNTELENQVQQLQAELKASGAGASAIQEKDSRISSLESELTEAKATIESLQAELASTKEEAIKELKEYQAQVKKLEKELKSKE